MLFFLNTVFGFRRCSLQFIREICVATAVLLTGLIGFTPAFSHADGSTSPAAPIAQDSTGPSTAQEIYPSNAGKSAGKLYSATEALVPPDPLTNYISTYDLVYQSTPTIAGYPGIVTGSLFVPKGNAPVDGWPLVAYAHGTTGVATKCAPSLAPNRGRDPVISALLHRKYAVVETDYRGLRSKGPHPYLYALSAAYDVLDSVKAVYQTGNHFSKSVLLFGFSQGGQAAQKAMEIAPTYAPGIHFLGSAEVVPLLTLKPMIDAMINHHLTLRQMYLFPYVIQGMKAMDPSVDMSDYLAGEFLRDVEGKQLCIPDLSANLPFSWNVNNDWYAPLSSGSIAKVTQFANENRLPIVKAEAPIFISRARDDTLIIASSQEGAIRKMCQLGDSVTLKTRSGDHGLEGSLDPALEWIDTVEHHRTPANNCATIMAAGNG